MTRVQDSVQQQFGAVAAAYATSSVHAAGEDLAALLEAAKLQGGERVLDVATGAGHTAIALARHGAHVTAFDLTAQMLAAAQHLAESQGVTTITYVAGDAEALPFPDASFDIVTCRYAAHHFPHPAQAAREWARVLRPGGRLLLGDVVAPDDVASDTFLNTAEILRDPSHVRDHTIPQWTAMLEAAGLTVTVVGVFPLRLEFAAWTTRMRTPEAAAAQIRTLFAHAPASVQETLHLEPDGTFTCPVAVLEGEKPR
ncbi:MAG: methyltransferase domain-containing protein [Thermomicrobiales bacterium]|nr:methyltransferase domain-containing protein [Thermomicrobiales bacterium]